MTTDININLKPCPFCGGHATMIYDKQDGYQIYCDDCDIRTEDFDDKDECIKTWERRVKE